MSILGHHLVFQDSPAGIRAFAGISTAVELPFSIQNRFKVLTLNASNQPIVSANWGPVDSTNMAFIRAKRLNNKHLLLLNIWILQNTALEYLCILWIQKKLSHIWHVILWGVLAFSYWPCIVCIFLFILKGWLKQQEQRVPDKDALTLVMSLWLAPFVPFCHYRALKEDLEMNLLDFP